MALTNNKMNKADTGYSNNAISGLTENRYVGQATTLKAKFDALTGEYVIPKFNALIDTLDSAVDGASGADNIGATPLYDGGASTVQAQNEYAYGKLSETSSGTFAYPTGTLTFGAWQRRNGYVRLSLMMGGANISQNGNVANISGVNGIPIAGKFVGTCIAGTSSSMIPCLLTVSSSGLITAANNAAATMSQVWFDVVMPASNI